MSRIRPENRSQGRLIDYDTDLHISITIQREINIPESKKYDEKYIYILNKSVIVSNKKLFEVNNQYGILGITLINNKGKRLYGHLNSFKIDHNAKLIERFEPYGFRKSNRAIQIDRIIDETFSRLVTIHLDLKFPYSFQLYYTNKLGPQSSDPKNTGYCYAWSILYIEEEKRKQELQKIKEDVPVEEDTKKKHLEISCTNGYNHEFIKKFTEELYLKYPNNLTEKESLTKSKNFLCCDFYPKKNSKKKVAHATLPN